MPAPARCYVKGSVVEVCFRAEQGLPLVATEAMKYMVKGVIAEALRLYPVGLSDLMVMANHLHMVLVVQSPEDLPRFLQYVKRESAHLINRILGRRKHTVWCDGSDTPVILDTETVIRRLSYIYLNPARAHLVESIDQYPNLSSWEAVLSGAIEESVYRIPRNWVVHFYRVAHSQSIPKALQYLRKKDVRLSPSTIRIEPFSWIPQFVESRDRDIENYRREVIDTVKHEQALLKRTRTKPVLGRTRLINQPIDTTYVSSKFGRRSVCLGATKAVRVQFLSWYASMREAARKAVRAVIEGRFIMLPPGFFYPGGYLLANVLPLASPLPLG